MEEKQEEEIEEQESPEELLKKKKQRKIRIIIQVVIFSVILGLCIFAIIKLYPIFTKMQNDTEYQQEMVNQLKSLGGWSWVVLTAIQVVQTVLAVIPAGPVVIITGMMYSPVIAVILCLIGQTLGALVVIFLVKLFGNNFLALFIDPDASKKFKVLKDAKKCGVLMFSYLLIPLLPKDPIAFIVPFTKVKVRYFVLINIFARIPMTIVSVLFGDSIISGQIGAGLIIGGCSAVLALLCFIFNKRIVAFIDKITQKKVENNLPTSGE